MTKEVSPPESTLDAASPPSTRKLLIGGGLAALVAAGILVFVVLPAEFGIDLTGTGEASGLDDLAQAGEMTELERGALRDGVLTLSEGDMVSDRWQIELRPYESVEFKYVLDENAPMIFSWSSTGEVQYDMHSHSFEGGEDLTESFGVGKETQMRGLYVAPFNGIHGWYWQNRTYDPIILTVEATGAMTGSKTFDSAGQHDRPISTAEKPAP